MMDNFLQNFEYFKQYYFSDGFVMKVVIPGLIFILILFFIKAVLNWSFRINTRIRELKKINQNLESVNENLNKIIDDNKALDKRLSNIEKKMQNLYKKNESSENLAQNDIEIIDDGNRGE